MNMENELLLLQAKWNMQISANVESIDPGENYCWRSLLLGFLLGNNVSLDVAHTVEIGAPNNGWMI